MQDKINSDIAIPSGQIDIATLLSAVWNGKKVIAACTVGLGGIAVATSLLMTPIFTATTTILPPQQQSNGLAAALGSLGALAGAAGSVAGLKNPSDLYIGMMQSTTISDRLIKKFDLQKRYEQETMVGARRALANTVQILAGKDGLISVSVDDPDPDFAAKLANAYIAELRLLNQNLAVTDAAQRRLFFEKQLEKVKEDLLAAEFKLQNVQKKTGLVQPEGQVAAIIKGQAELKAQIASRQVQLAAMRSFATPNNPDYQRLQQELITLRSQLSEGTALEKGSNISLSSGSLPETGLAYLRSLRDVKYQETLFELMAKQFELAKADEARDSSIIQVLDIALAPDQKSKPKRALMVALGVFMGFFIGLSYVLLRLKKYAHR